MTVDFEKLDAGLAELRGLDFEQAEMLTRRKNAAAIEISTCKEFQARLAAAALKVPYEEIAELPLKDYTRVTLAVVNFLFGTSDEETPSAN